jgi:hypothetical protein
MDCYGLTCPDTSPASSLSIHPARLDRPDKYLVRIWLGMLTVLAQDLLAVGMFGLQDPDAMEYLVGPFVSRLGVLQFVF